MKPPDPREGNRVTDGEDPAGRTRGEGPMLLPELELLEAGTDGAEAEIPLLVVPPESRLLVIVAAFS